MGFWFFKKRGENTSNSSAIQPYEVLNSNLRSSFSKIKVDIQFIRDWIHFFQDKNQLNEQRLKDIETKLDELEQVLVYMQKSQHLISGELIKLNAHRGAPSKSSESENLQLALKSEESKRDESSENSLRILNDLTETQKNMFIRIGTLLKESNQEWVSNKALADEFYPGKEYSDVRSTISEYVSILIDANLVKKQRKGKQTFIALTEKGKAFFRSFKKEVPAEQQPKKRKA